MSPWPSACGPKANTPKSGDVIGFVTWPAGLHVVPSREYSPVYVVPAFVSRSQNTVPVPAAICGSVAGPVGVPAISVRSSMRLIRVCPASAIGSSLT